jgi:hypothetical protein
MSYKSIYIKNHLFVNNINKEKMNLNEDSKY